jgi:hypothetical protein
MPAPGGVTVSLRGLGGAGPGRVWAVGDGAAVIERAADRWELPHWVDGFPARAMWAGGPDDLVLVGDAVTVRRWDGSAWRDVPTGLSQIGLTDVWGASADALFAVGRFTYAEGPAIAMSFNGTRWTTVPVPSLPDILLRSVHGDGAGTVMAVGDRGVILRRNSAAGFTTLVAPAPVPEPPDPPPPDLHAVWVYSATVAFAVGTADTILRWDGSAWTPMASPTTDVDLFAVWGAAPDDVFAAGRYATLLHWDGSSWQYEAHEAMADLIDIWGSGPNDIYVAGDNLTGTILHRCGTR